MTTDARSRPLSRLTAFRRASPSPAPTPPATTVLAHDGSYLDTLGLRLADGATRALAPPPLPPTSTSAQPVDVLRGRRPLPAGRGKAFAALIAAELHAASGNTHLQRAIVRLLPRPLSVLLTSLSTQLLPLLTPTSGPLLTPTSNSTAARAPFLVPGSAAQAHALALAGFAAELLEGLDAAGICGTGAPSDGLRGTREALDSLVGRVIPPLLDSLKSDLVALLDALEAAPPSAPASSSKGKVSQPVTALGALVQALPAIAKALATYTASTSPASASAKTAHARTLISIAWRALVALAYRPLPAVLPSVSAASISAAAAGAGGAPTPTPPRTPPASSFRKRLTPPSTPPGGRFTIRLPREPSLTLTAVSSSSRPPSPDSSSPGSGSAAVLSALAHEARTVSDLLATLPRPAQGTLARDAVDEAFGSLTHFAEYLSTQSAMGGDGVLAAKDVPDEVPTLIALPILLRFQRRPGGVTPPTEAVTVAGLLGLSEGEYRERCLVGFGRAEGCEDRVVQVVLAREGCVVDEDLKVWLTDG